MIESNLDKGKELLEELVDLHDRIVEETNHDYELIEAKIQRKYFKKSAKNLISYLALRRRDIRDIQVKLSSWGLSSLGRLESRTLYTLESVINRLAKIVDQETDINLPDLNDYNDGRERLTKNTEYFFGQPNDDRATAIMVTMPTEASEDKELLYDLMKAGMDVVRINCAHDNKDIWQKMIDNIHEVAEDLGQSVEIMMDIAGPKIRTEWVFTQHKKPQISKGHKIRMTSNMAYLKDLDPSFQVTVGCSIPQIFKQLKEGDPVLLDDGSIEMIVEETGEDYAFLHVKNVKGNSVRVKAEKGLNFPQTEFQVDILDDADKEALQFAVDHADIIGCSFIRTAQDILDIQNTLETMTEKPLGEIKLMLKIETVQAINNLAEVLLASGAKNPTSVLIARGDLAVESGYVRLAEIQQEILWLCEASDTPVVWGTEVLATMLDQGIPTRAEVTDAGEGSRAECVMLNKGKHMAATVAMLDQILVKMQEHQFKKTPTLRKLNIANYYLPKE